MISNFLTARKEFADWYDAKPEEVQFLIDEISDHTNFLIHENDYDKFIELLSEFNIVTVEQFF